MQKGVSSVRRYASSTWRWITGHKKTTIFIIIVALLGGYWYHKAHPAPTPTRYVLGDVATGTIVQTVSGSGQVSPLNQVTINPQASGQISEVLVKDGQQVRAGQAIAYINATDEYNAVQSAKASLQSSQLALEKLQEAPTTLQLTQDQNAIAKDQQNEQSDQTTLQNDYADAYTDMTTAYLDLPSIMTGLKDVDIGTEASNGAEWNIDFYKSATMNYDPQDAVTGRTDAYNTYESAVSDYSTALTAYQAISQSSATSTITATLSQTYSLTQTVGNALNSANSFVQFYQNEIKNQNQTPVSESNTALTNLSTYIGKMNTDASTLQSDVNKLQSDQEAIANDQRQLTQDQETLQQLQAGPDTLDVQSDQLSIQQQQESLQQAEDNLANYTITAPIAGQIADLNLNVGDTVGSGTAAATLITNEDEADLSLNEVDAAKVQVGQQATLTFDAFPDLSLTGTVVDVSPLGTVTSGVVSYNVKIAFTTQDPRVKAGMTVNADIETQVASDVMTVPASAIQTAGTQNYVLAFNPPITGVAASSTTGVTSSVAPEEIPVTIGITDNTNTQIDSGLTPGEQIVVRTTGGSNSTTISSAAAATTRGFGGGGGAVRVGGGG